jgi:dimethylglycine dehydrogenase
MFEASMERFIRLEKPGFTGKAATLSMHQRGARMKLVPLEVANTDSDCVGNEPVYSGDRIVGLTTSGGYGHAVRKSLAFAYVDPKMTGVGTGFDVLMFGEKRKASIVGESPWDPANARLKS